MANLTKKEIEKIFNTPQKRRCRDCIYLYEGDNGEWMCDDWEKDIHDIPDEDCAVENGEDY